MLTAAMKLKDSLEEKLWKPWQHDKRQRHHFTNKGSYCQSYGFSSSNIWMWMFDHKEGWVPKNWFFELWCWRRLLSVPWNARRSSQSILKDISPEYSVEGLMLKLMRQYFGHLMRRADSLENNLVLERLSTEGEGTSEDEIFGWHGQQNGHDFERTLGVN